MYSYTPENRMRRFERSGTGPGKSGQGDVTAEYSYDGLGRRIGQTAEGGHTGSVRRDSAQRGQAKTHRYDAFGTSIGLAEPVLFGFTGQPFDNATGLYNYGYRGYAPQIARFTTVDPIRDGANWYAYVGNDPVNFVDPLGLLAAGVGDGVLPGDPEPRMIDSTEGLRTSGFGTRSDPITGVIREHTGWDTANDIGTPVVAAADGRILETGNSSELGNYVIIAHDQYRWSDEINDYAGTTTRYYHLDSLEVSTRTDGEITEVIQGQRIGEMGNTGRSTGPHLHFEVRKDGIPQDPALYID